jgi:hypothetical protein
MPTAGIEAAFAARNWTMATASPVQFFTISSIFGTGYSTIVTHCGANGLITEAQVSSLLKFTPAKIFNSIFKPGTEKVFFKIIDTLSEAPLIDLEVSCLLLLPDNIEPDCDHLQKFQETSAGGAFIAVKPGIIHASDRNQNGAFIRIQNFRYAGLAEYRHLENSID